MRWSRFSLLGVLVFAACQDAVVEPPATGGDVPPVAGAISDGNNGGSEFFYLLPPLGQSASPATPFNGNLLPTVEVCLLTGSDCGSTPLNVVTFTADQIAVGDEAYQVNWDTDGPEMTTPLDPDENYRLRVLLGEQEVGFLDVNPQNPAPDTPGEDLPGLYAFRLGETLPIKFWLSEGVVCDLLGPVAGADGQVIECIEGVLTNDGGCLAIDQEGDQTPIGVCAPEGFLDNEGLEFIIATVERIQLADGEECLIGIDAPVFGPCLQLRTEPELVQPLALPAIVAICADLTDAEYATLQNHDQQDLLQIHRQGDAGGAIQGLTNAISTICSDSGVPQGSVASSGITGQAEYMLNRVLTFFGPQPVAAADLGLGGLTRFFSRFQWALGCQLGIAAGDGQRVQLGQQVPETPAVSCVDALGQPVANAKVRFSSADDGLVLDVTSDFYGTDDRGEFVRTDLDGVAAVGSWAPGVLNGQTGQRGENTLTAFGYGLLGPDDSFSPHQGDPTQQDVQFDLVEGMLDITATATDPPAGIIPNDADGSSVEVGSTLSPPLQVTVVDEVDTDGNATVTALGVPGITLTWTVTSGNGGLLPEGCEALISGDPACGSTFTQITTTTNSSGESSLTFIVGTTAGSNVVTVTTGAGADQVTQTFTVTGLPGAPASVSASSGDGQSAFVGDPLAEDLVVLVTDAFGNAVPGVTVDWTVASGGGSVSSATSTTDATGLASTSWTLGGLLGTQTLTASAGGFSASFSATGVCFDGFGTAEIDGTLGAAEWACATAVPFEVNLGSGTPPEATLYHMNDGTYLYLAVVVAATDRVNRLRFDFDNEADGVLVEGEDGFEFDPATGLFSDEYLTAKCTNSSQSGCGSVDDNPTPNGSGAFSNATGFTVYELRKELNSGDPQDFSLQAGDTTRMFWTLRLGNGAKGNTQAPGFRVWYDFEIVGR